VQSKKVGQGLQAFTSQFSVTQAMTSVLPLRQLVNSPHPQAKKVADHMLETAAIMQQMGDSNTRYEQVQRPRATAYQQ
jgi:hypothetical protein